jgi:transcriptional regulator with XRE-family HTH domain
LIGQHAFGARLRTQRERQGVSLAAIADSTKIKLSLLDELERGDVSHWPRGLFRRAYLRDYATAIGAPSEPLVAEFVRLFPEDGAPADESPAVPAQEPMRLTFPEAPQLASQRVLSSVGGAAAELTGVLAAGVVLSWASGMAVMAACGAVALAYYPLATAITGRTLSATRLSWLVSRFRPGTPPVPAEEPATLYLVPRTAPVSQAPSMPIVAAPLAGPLVAVPSEDAPARHSAAV